MNARARATSVRRADTVAFRPERPDDEPTVRRAHVDYRLALFGGAGLPADALMRLCDQQHDLQERHIATHHPLADRRMIVAAGAVVGRLCIDRSATPWRVVDMALVASAQQRGHGSEALLRLLAEARRETASVDLYVGRDNPRAEALYRRLGFVDAIDASQTHRRLIWTPAA